MNARSKLFVPATFALLVACDGEPPVQSAVQELRFPSMERQTEEACGEAGEACCEEEACAEPHECSEGVCVYPFLEPRDQATSYQ
jgi:hypothetical protein